MNHSTSYIDPKFFNANLSQYQGYHLQVFRAGRAKISLQAETQQKHEYFAQRPKRDLEGYGRQKARSRDNSKEHFRIVDRLLADNTDAKVYRLYAKGNNNETADNAHLIASVAKKTIWLVMGTITHRWIVLSAVVEWLVSGKGARTGEQSLFNEYMPSYEHDWQDASFLPEDYKHEIRDNVFELNPQHSSRTNTTQGSYEVDENGTIF
ncbi:hypothetical protein [Celeribacter neptunius]|uniref:Uncharacterized protein n=1 Tax=Celeribacter neptunius TaxID=588602 RepID=A0A1I3SA87_9RHOB|nr:hypothetical protein [Celeribacter neptunius]SFJ55605.1 hypothetical protein SAMN04487991_2391 [Celeribacter neptunius]